MSRAWRRCSRACPSSVPGQTVNRLCGSGLQAVASAAQALKAGEGDAFIAGGVESMTRAPYVMLKSGTPWNREIPAVADSTLGWRFVNPRMKAEWTIPLGMTAEKVARQYGITREEQDAFALESQRRAGAAIRDGVFKDEIVPVEIRRQARRPGRRLPGRTSQAGHHPRQPGGAYVPHSLPTAPSRPATPAASTMARLRCCSYLKRRSNGARPLARVVASAVAGVDPSVMGIGPVPATRKALKRAGLRVDQIDLVELNEAFASQAIACMRDLELDPARVNVYGGAIALGHALGSSGSRMLATLVHALHRRNARYGLATMCIGVGQGIAVIVENVKRT